MQHVDAQVMVSVHLGNQIRGGDVEEVSRCEGNDETHVDLEGRHVGGHSPQQERERGEGVDEQGAPLIPTAVQ